MTESDFDGPSLGTLYPRRRVRHVVLKVFISIAGVGAILANASRNRHYMNYVKLILGIAILAIFIWIFARNRQRMGLIHTLGRIDTLVGIICGLYLILSSVKSLL